MGFSYAQWQSTVLAPVWLRRAWGTILETVLGTYKDYLVGAAKDAVKAAQPATAPTDALGYIGAARNIERYSADTDTTYRTRITDPWSLWEFGATRSNMVARLADAGYSDAYVKSWRERTPNVPDAYQSWWSAFWIVIPSAHGFTAESSWGSGTWGEVDGTGAPLTWGSSATLYQVNELRGLVRKWKAAEEVCAGIELVLSGEVWENLTPWNDTTWGGTVVVWPV